MKSFIPKYHGRGSTPIDGDTTFLAHFDQGVNDSVKEIHSIGHQKALYFAEDGYIEIQNPLSHQGNLEQEWTVEAWVKIETDIGKSQFLIEGINLGVKLIHDATGKALLYLNSGSNDYYSYGSFNLGDDQWHHVAFVFRNEDGLRRIYIDGDQYAYDGPNKTSAPAGINSRLYIGKNVVGSISDIKVWDRVLSIEEIEKSRKGLVKSGDSNLVGYWKLNEGEGNIAYDFSKKGNNGNIVNAQWSEGMASYTLIEGGFPKGKIKKQEETKNVFQNPCFDDELVNWIFASWSTEKYIKSVIYCDGLEGIQKALRIERVLSGGSADFHQGDLFDEGKTYTMSAWVRGNGDFTIHNHWDGELSRISLTEQWQKVTATFIKGGSEGNYAWFRANHILNYVEITGAQVEEKAFATDFTRGVRSAREAYGGGVLLEEGTQNLWSNLNGRASSLTAGGTTAPTVELVNMETPFGSEAWKVTLPANNDTGYFGCRVTANSATMHYDGQPYSYFTYVYGDLNNIYIYPTGSRGQSGCSHDPNRDIGDWMCYVHENRQDFTGGSGSLYMSYYASSVRTSPTVFYIAIVQLEQKSYSTSFTENVRDPCYLAYPKEMIHASEGTISFWFNPYQKNPNEWSALATIGAWDDPPTKDWFSVYWGQDWNEANRISFAIHSQEGEGVSVKVDSMIHPHSWLFVVARWNFNNPSSRALHLTVWDSEGKENHACTSLNFDPPTYEEYSLIYVGCAKDWTPNHVVNAIVDELRIDKVYRTNSEIRSWYFQGKDHSVLDMDQPFPIDLYTAALFHYDIDASDQMKGLKPIGSEKTLHFDGTYHINLGNPSQLQIVGDLTIEMWLKPSDFSERRNPIAKAYGGEYTITQEKDGDISWYYGTHGGNGSPYHGVRSTKSVQLHEWNHVAIVRDMTVMKMFVFINGEEAGSTSITYTPVAGNNSILIGAGYVSPYIGEIRDIRIWAKAKSRNSIYDEMYDIQDKTDLRARWLLTEGTGEVIYDSSPYYHHGISSSELSWLDGETIYSIVTHDSTFSGNAIAIEEETTNQLPSQDHFITRYVDTAYDSISKEWTVTVPAGSTNSWRGILVNHSPVIEKAGATYTFSFEIYTEQEGVYVSIDLNNQGVTTSTGTNDNRTSASYTNTGLLESKKWIKMWGTYTVKNDQDYTCNNNIYYHNNLIPETEVTYKVRNIQHQKSVYPTTFIDGTRPAGNVIYPLKINADVFTMNFWAKTYPNNDFYMLMETSNNNHVFLKTEGETALDGGKVINGEIVSIGKSTIRSASEWNMYTLVSHGEFMSMYQNGDLLRQNRVGSLRDSAIHFTFNGQGRTNFLIGGLRVDEFPRTQEEIQSWFVD
ncbi:LamG domain-containing protein [Chengkuizengella axinellae]|uniref:LamG domain-containing protein n=1 Tax=Chengkuizengella axinellae TaxID=3064388 RepID=A0ABT9IX26_9BACL|nr:LamG domain-containing protein [Chengkuizengella sp. 2205SS18-9]MDP5273662.1 LamG domain-containing protein [Chengkuizengella sp. 2205SS18-9]